MRGEIQFQAVRFAYPVVRPGQDGISLHIRAGETIALTGANGAGKSTLAHLLMRLMSPGGGRILIDGIDIATVTLASLRCQIGVVPQHVLLFNGSVFDNIAYGLPDSTPAAVKAAARAAQAHAFITRLPQGYDSIIGDQGIRLSAASASALPWPARCSKTRPSWCWTKPPPCSTPRARNPSSPNATTPWPGAPSSSSRIARPAWHWRTGCCGWRTGCW
ncbi:MAG: ATP-binding cassette domain-containing protein [Comamonadaceae bacterium]|nr:ATP-binding cassette domain-containing protein [Comamonadaceae bacterium]